MIPLLVPEISPWAVFVTDGRRGVQCRGIRYSSSWMVWIPTDWMAARLTQFVRCELVLCELDTMDVLDDNGLNWIELDEDGNRLDDDDSSPADSICEVIGCGANWTEWWINYLAPPTPTSSTTLFSL